MYKEENIWFSWAITKFLCEPPYSNLYRMKNKTINTIRVSRDMCARFSTNWFTSFRDYWILTNSQSFLYLKKKKICNIHNKLTLNIKIIKQFFSNYLVNTTLSSKFKLKTITSRKDKIRKLLYNSQVLNRRRQFLLLRPQH